MERLEWGALLNRTEPMDKQLGPDVPHAADQTVFSRRSALRMPLDLSEWVARETLAQWVRAQVECLDRTQPEVKAFFEQPPDASETRAKAVLSVLVLAYATQTFTTGEILDACRTDPVYRGLCDGFTLSTDAFSRCRRQHRRLVEQVLAKVLVRAVGEHYVQLAKLPPGLTWSLTGRASDRLDTAHLLDSCEECER